MRGHERVMRCGPLGVTFANGQFRAGLRDPRPVRAVVQSRRDVQTDDVIYTVRNMAPAGIPIFGYGLRRCLKRPESSQR